MSSASKPPLPEDRRLPHPARLDARRLDYQEIIRRHEAAMTRLDATYQDPATGLHVFTALALWERGYCCDSGCRHCPFLQREPAAGNDSKG